METRRYTEEEYLAELRKAFEENRHIKKMRRDVVQFNKTRNYSMAKKIQEKIDKLWKQSVEEYHTSISLEDVMKEMNDEDRETFWKNLCAVFMMVDCFDFLLAEVNEIVARQKESYVFDKFDGILKLARKSEFEMKKFGGEMTESFLMRFAENSDELREEILKFASKFIIESHESRSEQEEKDKPGCRTVRAIEST